MEFKASGYKMKFWLIQLNTKSYTGGGGGGYDVTQKTRVFVSQILRHYLTLESRIRKLFGCSIQIEESYFRKFEGLTRSKILGIWQTELTWPIIGGKERLKVEGTV